MDLRLRIVLADHLQRTKNAKVKKNRRKQTRQDLFSTQHLPRRKAFIKVPHNKAFQTAIFPEYDRYQQGFASMVFKII